MNVITRQRTLTRSQLLRYAILGTAATLVPNEVDASTPKTKSTTRITPTLFAHYYPWYSGYSQFRHWNGGDSTRPNPQENLATAYYPSLGPYDSLDIATTLNQHMQWLKLAGVDVLIVSWWGKGSYEDNAVSGILDRAAKYGLRVCFQIEPYAGRSATSTVNDIAYLYSRYGRYHAFYRAVRPTLNGPNTASRGLFFLFAPTDPTLASTISSIRGTQNDAIILVRTDDSKMYIDADVRGQIGWTGADGMYNFGFYDAISTYNTQLPWSPDYLLIYAACPGFDNSRAPGVTTPVIVPRNAGASYDSSWTQLALQRPEGVALVSFNEWHEGTQVEPAVPFQYETYTYSDYTGSYGTSGAAATTSYLTRTTYWANRYKGT